MDFVRVHACHQHTISTVNRNCRPCARRLPATRRSWYSRNSERRLLRRTITVHRPCDRITRVTVLLVTRALHLRGLVRLASTRTRFGTIERTSGVLIGGQGSIGLDAFRRNRGADRSEIFFGILRIPRAAVIPLLAVTIVGH